MKPLEEGWRERLCREPRRALVEEGEAAGEGEGRETGSALAPSRYRRKAGREDGGSAPAERALLPRAGNGIRFEDLRLNEADDLRKCLAFDAAAAFQVWSLTLITRERPDDPARLYVAQDDIDKICALAARRGFKAPRGPADMDIRTFELLAAGQAGSHFSKRQPLPGTQ